MTFEQWLFSHIEATTYRITNVAPTLTRQSGSQTSGMTPLLLTSWSAASPVKTCPLRASGKASTVNDQFSLLSSSELQNLSPRDGSSWRTYRGSCRAIADETSPDSSMKWSPAGMASAGECSMPATSEFRSVVGESSLSPVEPTLSSILEPRADSRYALSSKAAAGILRRAGRRGRTLPPMLEEALRAVASSAATETPTPDRPAP